MPTRYNLDLADGLKSIVTAEALADDTKRVEARKQVKKAFEERYNSGKNPWFFKKLRM
jgi:large subunit ribosomal protein L27e